MQRRPPPPRRAACAALTPPPRRALTPPLPRRKAEGNAAFARGSFREAEAAYTRALALAPQLPALAANRAAARLKLGDWTGAEADASAALELEKGSVKALLRRGQVRPVTEHIYTIQRI